MKYYEKYNNDVSLALSNTAATTEKSLSIDSETAFRQWVSMTRDVFGNKQTIYFIGNGASAAMASHMAADAVKNGKLRAMVFNDLSLMTAVSNDLDYTECFAEPLRRFGLPGDLLISISSSGNSPNIIKGIEAAREQQLGVVTLSGMSPDNQSRKLGDVNFYVPADTYGIVECAHQVLLHCWLDLYMGV